MSIINCFEFIILLSFMWRHRLLMSLKNDVLYLTIVWNFRAWDIIHLTTGVKQDSNGNRHKEYAQLNSFHTILKSTKKLFVIELYNLSSNGMTSICPMIACYSYTQNVYREAKYKHTWWTSTLGTWMLLHRFHPENREMVPNVVMEWQEWEKAKMNRKFKIK